MHLAISSVSVCMMLLPEGKRRAAGVFPVGEFMSAMQKMHVPERIAGSLSVVMRFFSTPKEEYSAISNAMKMRGDCIRKRKSFQNAGIPHDPTAVFLCEYRRGAVSCCLH